MSFLTITPPEGLRYIEEIPGIVTWVLAELTKKQHEDQKPEEQDPKFLRISFPKQPTPRLCEILRNSLVNELPNTQILVSCTTHVILHAGDSKNRVTELRDLMLANPPPGKSVNVILLQYYRDNGEKAIAQTNGEYEILLEQLQPNGIAVLNYFHREDISGLAFLLASKHLKVKYLCGKNDEHLDKVVAKKQYGKDCPIEIIPVEANEPGLIFKKLGL